MDVTEQSGTNVFKMYESVVHIIFIIIMRVCTVYLSSYTNPESSCSLLDAISGISKAKTITET